MTLADILAPMPPERFFAEYYDQQPLHLPGAAEKFAGVLDWAGINRLLGMTHIWSERSLKVVLDSTTIPPAQYSQSAMSRDGANSLQPIPAKGQYRREVVPLQEFYIKIVKIMACVKMEQPGARGAMQSR